MSEGKSRTSGIVQVSFASLVQLLETVFKANGTSDEVAHILATNCASAERDGALSHGVFRVPGYLSTLHSGWVNGRAVPAVTDVAGAFVQVDANNGFAQPALAAATPLALQKVRAAGCCVLAIRNSHHFGALWLDVEPFADQGIVVLSVVNSMAVVVPHGASRPVFGTNPMAFAAPRGEGRPPLVFDQAVSTIAHGDLQIAALEGNLVPEGVGVDSEGRPTRDPKAILEGGALLPFGGHKGNSIALMIEIFAAALTGGRFSFEVDWSLHPGALTPCTGQLLILIDAARTGSLRAFTGRVESLILQLHDAGQDRLPGDRRYAAREQAASAGIALAVDALARLKAAKAIRVGDSRKT